MHFATHVQQGKQASQGLFVYFRVLPRIEQVFGLLAYLFPSCGCKHRANVSAGLLLNDFGWHTGIGYLF
jgi:hypothetical protein